jgi:hypothetical protein
MFGNRAGTKRWPFNLRLKDGRELNYNEDPKGIAIEATRFLVVLDYR